uniref:Glycosyltransferase 2-like domain-containing protein n=1 Tax=viral metagenome TaxID=1070528 RepID=A0A6C0F2E5_9ZZZZ
MTKKSKPFVSVCTPTFNRRPFIPIMFECFRNQTYSKDLIEWIIIDDGTDKIKDLVKGSNIPQIKYYELPEKIPLGAKRNLMHEKAKGSIIVYMDDDDYYPPERIEHAVEVLTANKKALCAGSSELYLYFKHISKMYQFGPYGPNHATAGTFAFKRELLDITKYNETACIAEEREFLKDYTIPFVQLDPLKTILIFSHVHNTFDKRRLLDNPNSSVVKESNKTVDMFIKFTDESKIKRFFLNDIDEKLAKYEAGKPSMKPDVLKQTKEIDERRKQQQQPQIIMQQDGKDPVALDPNEIINMINGLRSNLKAVMARNDELEDMLEKKTTVKFSEPIEAPSSSVQKLKKEISELEFKLKQSAIIEADLRTDIDRLRKQPPAPAKSQATIPVSAIMQTSQISELQFKLKQSSIIEAELRAEIETLRKQTPTPIQQTPPPKLTPQPKPTVFIERLKSEPELFVKV